MSTLAVEKDGKPVAITAEYQAIWQAVENNEVGANELFFADATDEFPSDQIQNIAHFLAVSGEMVGARLDDFKYVMGDADCLDIEEWTSALIVRVEV
jgi:hypothetical protein